MCGIVGVVNRGGNKLVTTKDLMTEMLLVGSVRGLDSTGVFTVDHKKRVDIHKKALHSHDYLQLRQTHKLLANLHTKQVMIGHNRAATKGGVTDDMAHPFTYGRITLVHNGTLYNHRSLHKDTPNFVSDSEALCWSMNHMGAQAALEAVTGSFSVIWYDSEDDTINLCRNGDRPMSMATVDKGARVVFASESRMLRWMLERAGMDIDESLLIPAVGVIFSFKLNENTPYTATQIKLYEPPVTHYGSGHFYNNNPSQKYLPRKKSHNQQQRLSATTVNLTANRTSKMERLLEPLGRSLYDKIIFWGGKFEPYEKGSDFGKLSGYDEFATADTEVVSHMVHKDEVLTEGDFDSHLYEARIKAATADVGTGLVVINVDEVRAINFSDYYSDKTPGTVTYMHARREEVKPPSAEYGTECGICGGDIDAANVGYLPINEHVLGIKDEVCCISCADIIKKQNTPNWDSLLITTVM